MLNFPVPNANDIGQWFDKSDSGCTVKCIKVGLFCVRSSLVLSGEHGVSVIITLAAAA